MTPTALSVGRADGVVRVRDIVPVGDGTILEESGRRCRKGCCQLLNDQTSNIKQATH